MIRAATPADLDTLVEQRLALLTEVAEPARRATVVAMGDATRRALARAFERGTLLAWLAVEETPLGSLIALLDERLPTLSCPNAREAYVAHLWVAPRARGRGLGTSLLAALAAHATACRLERVRLHSAEKATSVYLRAGWQLRTLDMERRFTDLS